MTTATLSRDLRLLPIRDRVLVGAMAGAGLFALALGLGFGALTAFVRAGFIEVDLESGYRLMTLHGTTVFFYWLYFGQTAMLLALAVVYGREQRRFAMPAVAWTGFLLMAAGFVASQAGAWTGAPLLYDGSPELVGERRLSAGLFYLGYLLLGLGLFLLAVAAVATALAGRAERPGQPWSTIGFGVVAWAGLLMVSAVAMLNAFLPAMLWTFGWGGMPADHSTGWHILFHNLHYLPLMGTVLIWYALIQEMTGVGSIFGDRFSKAVFTSYLIFVPPTSLYHMFLEPDLAPFVRTLGSLLSLFISVPTVAMFLVIVASLEAHARLRGARGLFGWVRLLPWRDPVMSAIGMSVVNLALGGVFAFVLIQEQLAKLLSDTFFVPAYFHFLTIGTVSLTLLAALMRVIPALVGTRVWSPRLLANSAYAVTIGLVIFGGAGIAAGVQGMPRRILDAAYGGAAPPAWGSLSRAVGVGAAIMTAALAIYVYGLARMFIGPKKPAAEKEPGAPVVLVTPSGAVLRQAAWTGPLSVAVLVAAMYAATALAFAIMRALPVVGAGGGGH